LSAHEDQRSINEMLAGGAGSYVVKGMSAKHILDAVHGSAAGQSVLSQPIASKVVSELASRLEQEKSQEMQNAEWDARIRRILANHNELTIVFQPIADLASGRVVGVEALSRFASEPPFRPDVWFAQAAALGHGL